MEEKIQAGESSVSEEAGEKRGVLYLCATPIGNLEDITLRVLRTLREASLIAAEDTRNTLKLLNRFGIRTPLTSYHEHNKYEKAAELTAALLSGKTVALVTDAGTPCISDPGEELVKQAVEAGIRVESLPGAAACITALTVSALPARRFAFEGFLPREKKERARLLGELAQEARTMILYEAPHRLTETLACLREALGGARRLALCRELTKLHEEVLRLTIDDALALYTDGERTPRGEYVLVIEGKSPEEKEEEGKADLLSLSVREHVERYLLEGRNEKEAMRLAARDRGVSRREIYAEYKVSKE